MKQRKNIFLSGKMIFATFLTGCVSPGEVENSQPVAEILDDGGWRRLAQCIGYELKRPVNFSERRKTAVIRSKSVDAAFGGTFYSWSVTVNKEEKESNIELRNFNPTLDSPDLSEKRFRKIVNTCP